MPDDRQLIIDYLSTHDAWCEKCAYALRNLNPPGEAPLACPECGVELTMKVGAAREPLGGWLLAVIGLCLGAGFDGVVSTVMWGVFIYHGLRSPGPVFPVLISGFTTLTIAGLCCLAWTVRSRTNWLAWKDKTRWTRGWAVFVTVFFVHLAWAGSLMLLA